MPVSAAATWAFGGNADGNRGCGSGAVGVAALAGLTTPVAPATAAAARNLRRLNFRLEFFFGMVVSPIASLSKLEGRGQNGRQRHGDRPTLRSLSVSDKGCHPSDMLPELVWIRKRGVQLHG